MKKSVVSIYTILVLSSVYWGLASGDFKEVADANGLVLNNKMNIYSFYTPSHEVLKNDWFVPSLKDDFNVIIIEGEQVCPTGVYYAPGFQETIERKVDIIIDAVKQNWGKIFVYADIDIQFFEQIQPLIEAAMVGKDIVVQQDNPNGYLCSGFFACRGNERVLAVWQEVKRLMVEERYDDQNALNKVLLRNGVAGVVWDRLPPVFFGTGTLKARPWLPGKWLFVPHDIVMHHANWTKGIHNKIALLAYVKSVVDKKARVLS